MKLVFTDQISVFFALLTLIGFVLGFTTITTPFDVTTLMAANGSLNESDCWCPCDDELFLNNTLPADQELNRLVLSIITGLAVDKKTVSQTIRKKISAPDDRPSARGLGYVGVLVIISSIVTVIFLDIQSLVTDFKKARLNIKKILEESESMSITYSGNNNASAKRKVDINRPKIS